MSPRDECASAEVVPGFRIVVAGRPDPLRDDEHLHKNKGQSAGSSKICP